LSNIHLSLPPTAFAFSGQRELVLREARTPTDAHQRLFIPARGIPAATGNVNSNLDGLLPAYVDRQRMMENYHDVSAAIAIQSLLIPPVATLSSFPQLTSRGDWDHPALYPAHRLVSSHPIVAPPQLWPLSSQQLQPPQIHAVVAAQNAPPLGPDPWSVGTRYSRLDLEMSRPREERRIATVSAVITSRANLAAPLQLPAIFADPVQDEAALSGHQAFLRLQIEVFEATIEDVSAHVRGRNKRVELNQVGIRCRHCAHVWPSHRQKGSVYFPASILGLYQAAQNMSSTHLQCGACKHMPETLKTKFAELIPTKNVSSKGGRVYWAHSAKEMGLVDTVEHGICFIRGPVA
jgi:hypothetical protein